MKRRVIVIGAGPAGMTAAICAAAEGAQVLLLEHMDRVGKKILSTGNGKCNLTNEVMSEACYHTSQPEFLRRALSLFGKEETLAYMQKIGIVPRARRGYFYPASEQASAVLDALRYACEAAGVEIRTGLTIRKIARADGFLVASSAGTFTGDALILAAGSQAAPKTGSDGSGYELARSLGHRVIRPLPALVQLKAPPALFKPMAGLRMEAGLTLFADGQAVAEERGELQCVDYGISGIPVFQLSGPAIRLMETGHTVEMELDFLPDLTAEALGSLLKERRKTLTYLNCEEFLTGIFPRAAAIVFLKKAGIPLHEPCTVPAETAWKRFSRTVKAFRVPITGYNGFDRAQTCSGGVDPAQVRPETMESRRVPELYFAGEILDVDGICGGYNLQWAWTSGTLAGRAAAKAEVKR